MKPLLFALITLAASAVSSGQTTVPNPDPFGSGAPAWTDAIQTAKPYRLEIAYGETATPLPTEENDGTLFQNPTVQLPNSQKTAVKDRFIMVTDDFLKSAKRMNIAFAANDSGSVEREGGDKVIYSLKPESAGFSLQISLRLKSGRSELNTRITLPESKWVVLGNFSQEERSRTQGQTTDTVVRHYSYMAVRVIKAGN